MTNIYFAIAIILAIGISYKTKINTGLLAIAFAYIIGVYDLKLSPDAVIALWPVSIFFTIFAVTLFFSVAIENGTLEKISERFLHRSRGATWGLAFVFLLTAIVISGLGAGFYAVMVFLCPAALLISTQVKIEPLVAGLAVVVGAQAGSNFMSSLNGIIYRGLFEKIGFSSGRAFTFSFAIFIAYLVLVILVIGGLTLFFRRRAHAQSGTAHQKGYVATSDPEPFDMKQRMTLWLIGLFLLLALVPSIIHVLGPSLSWAAKLNNDMDVPLLTVVLTVVAMLIGVVDRRAVINRIPWNILIMITGVGMLIQVAVTAGTINDIAHWLSTGAVPTFLIPLLLALAAAVITSFGSFIGITAPALFPIIPVVAHMTGLSPELLFICTTISGLSMAISPYSEGGAMVLSFSPKEAEDAMYGKELKIGLPAMGLSALVATVILTAVW